MSVFQRYGHTRPAAITARLDALRARFAPVASEAPTEPVLVPVPDALETAVEVQTLIKTADLPVAMSQRLDGINALLGTHFTSSTQLSPDELHAVTDAIEANRFASDWTLRAPIIDEDAPLPAAPPESEPLTDTGTTPAPLESLDEIAMEFDLAQMRRADRARTVNALSTERIMLAQRLCEIDHQLLVA